jgi:hypothetical protein
MMYEDDSALRRLTKYIHEVAADPYNRVSEAVAILTLTFGVWMFGAYFILTAPLRWMAQ